MQYGSPAVGGTLRKDYMDKSRCVPTCFSRLLKAELARVVLPQHHIGLASESVAYLLDGISYILRAVSQCSRRCRTHCKQHNRKLGRMQILGGNIKLLREAPAFLSNYICPRPRLVAQSLIHIATGWQREQPADPETLPPMRACMAHGMR